MEQVITTTTATIHHTTLLIEALSLHKNSGDKTNDATSLFRLNQILNNSHEKTFFKRYLVKIRATEPLLFIEYVDDFHNLYTNSKTVRKNIITNNLANSGSSTDNYRDQAIQIRELFLRPGKSTLELNTSQEERMELEKRWEECMISEDPHVFDTIYQSQKILLSQQVLLGFEESQREAEKELQKRLLGGISTTDERTVRKVRSLDDVVSRKTIVSPLQQPPPSTNIFSRLLHRSKSHDTKDK